MLRRTLSTVLAIALAAVAKATTVDHHGECKRWAAGGQCEDAQQREWMLLNCARSCRRAEGRTRRRQPRCSLCPTVASLVVDPAGPDAVSAAAALLRDCGVAVLSRVHGQRRVDALRQATTDHVSSTRAGRYQFQSVWFGQDERVDPRTEYLLPFAPPFNDTEVFLPPIVERVLRRHFFSGAKRRLRRFYLEHSFVIRAWGNGHEAQDPHTDNDFPGVVVQVPVAPVTKADGPTMLHLCTHGSGGHLGRGEEGRGVPFTVGGNDGWAPLGSVLLYDASLLHYGSANTGPRHRDVLFFHFCRAGRRENRPAIDAVEDQRSWRRHVFSRDAGAGGSERVQGHGEL